MIGFALFGDRCSGPAESTDYVTIALKLLVQVSNDFKRQITAKNFARIPHEYVEYTEAADALRSATKHEPADFEAKVETRPKASVMAYQEVSDMSANTPDVDKLAYGRTRQSCDRNE